LLHNGVVDTTVGTGGVITCTAGADTNEWKVSCTIPSTGYNANDTIEYSATSTVSSVTQSNIVARDKIDSLQGVLFDYGVVASSPAPTATTFSSQSLTLTATVAGAYIGSFVQGQNDANIGCATRVVTGHTITAGSPPTHNFALTTATGITPVVGPAVGGAFIMK
jgi:hypothetical protein